MKTPVERFDTFVLKGTTSEECNLWTGALNSKGYGCFAFGGKIVLAHRWAYEQTKGEITPKLVIDHICRNKRCVNVSHLRAVTQAENTLCGEGPTAKNKQKTECHKGHPFTEENTIWKAKGTRRNCRECNRAYRK